MSHRHVLPFIGIISLVSYFWYCILTPQVWHFVDFVNLIFHEAGHTITIFFPDIITALGGSILQILVPIVCAGYFYQRGELLSANLISLWVAQNLSSVSLYVRDAPFMNLPLLGGESVIHDWNFILSTIGILDKSALLANVFLIIGYTILVVSTILIVQYFWHPIEGGDSVKTGK